MTIAHINTHGMNQIWKALDSNHKFGGGQNHFTAAMMNAWAADAEESFANGKGMCFEIKSFESSTGRTEVVTITADGYDVDTFEQVAS